MKTIEQLQKRAIDIIENECFMREPKTLFEPIEYAMKQGGKRVRPLLCLLAADLFSQDITKAEPAAKAIEILHNFTLLHDDIMDASPLRRGKPTVYNKYSTNAAILSGDTMFALAFEYLLTSDKENIAELARLLTQGSVDVCRGQAMDMDFEKRNDVRIEEYIEMISLKTGVLLSTALCLGAVAVGAKTKDIEFLYDFGINIGVAFQLQDDIFDVWSNLEEFGKVTGTDIIDNKKTFLYLKALKLSDGEQRKELERYFSSTSFDKEEKQEAVRKIYEDLNLCSIAKEEMQKYNDIALQSLEKIDCNSEKKANLITFANQLMFRTK